MALVVCAAMLRMGYTAFDDSVYVWIADRLRDGAILHRDVAAAHPGYTHFINVWLYSQFGTDVLVLRYPLPILSALLVWAVAWLTKPAGFWVQMTSALAATALGVVQFITPSASWYAGTCAALSMVAMCLAYTGEARHRNALLFLAGLLIGLCAGFRQYNGALLGAGLVILHTLTAPASIGIPSFFKQALSLAALIAAIILLVLPLACSFSVSGAMLCMPVLVGATRALVRWKLSPAVRNPDWLLPVLSGCVIGFIPIVLIALWQGAITEFFQDTVIDAMLYTGYSASRGFDFGIMLTDAMEAFALPGSYPKLVSLYLIAIFALPLWYTWLFWSSANRLNAQGLTVCVLAAVSLLNQLAFQGLIYAFYWLPAVCAAALTLGRARNRNWSAVLPIVALSLFGLAFHAGRITGANWKDVFSTPFVPQTACSLPRCGVRLDPAMNENLLEKYHDLVAEVPPDHALLLLPSGVVLYPFLPHRSPWYTGFVQEGFTPEAYTSRLRTEFSATPGAVLAVSSDYLAAPGPVSGMDDLINSVCLIKRTRHFAYYKSCPPAAEPGASSATMDSYP